MCVVHREQNSAHIYTQIKANVNVLMSRHRTEKLYNYASV